MTAGSPEHSPEPPTPERSGPLAVARHRKTDGRLLVLYRRAVREERDHAREQAAASGEERDHAGEQAAASGEERDHAGEQAAASGEERAPGGAQPGPRCDA